MAISGEPPRIDPGAHPGYQPPVRRMPPEVLPPGGRAISWPVIPVIPNVVASGHLISSNWGNSVRQGIEDVWTNLQALNLAVGGAGGGVPPTRQVIAGAGLSGGGALSADVTLTANVTTVFGRSGAVVLTAADIAGSGYTVADDT